MGHKVNPKSLRLKVNRTWDSIWFASKKNYSNQLLQDLKLRKEIINTFKDGGISKVDILRNAGKILVNIATSRPGLIIGRQGTQIDELKTKLSQKYGSMEINVKEIKKPEIDATLIADNVARQIERRVAFRRVAKDVISKAMEGGAKGIKIRLGGRLNGVEIARVETFKEGNIPLHTFRSKIDYSEERSNTMYGVIGVKVWVYKGDSFKNVNKKDKVAE